MKNTIIVSSLVAICTSFIVILTWGLFQTKNNIPINIGLDSLGTQLVGQAYWSKAETGSTTLNSNTITLIYDVKNTTTTNSYVCNTNTNGNNQYIFLHPRATTTTSGLRINEGIMLAPTSTNMSDYCKEFPGFRGKMYGISNTTSTASWGLAY